MEHTEALRRMDNDKLLDIVKNYRQYGYEEELRNEAISLLGERGWSEEELQMFGHLHNYDYDTALSSYNSFRRNVKLGYAIAIVSLGTLSLISIICFYLAYRNQAEFYRALGKEDESDLFTDILGVLSYFHKRNRMKEQLQGIS